MVSHLHLQMLSIQIVYNGLGTLSKGTNHLGMNMNTLGIQICIFKLLKWVNKLQTCTF